MERNANYSYILKNTLRAVVVILNSPYLKSAQFLIFLNPHIPKCTKFSNQTFSSSCLVSSDHNLSPECVYLTNTLFG